MSSTRLSAVLLTMAFAATGADKCFAQSAPSPESQIQRIITKQEVAWNVGDSSGFGSAFTEDADFINILGQAFHGREAITQVHNMILNGPSKGSHATVTIHQFRQLTPDVVLVEAMYEVTGYKSLPPGITPTSEGVLKTRVKYVLIKRDEAWQIVAAQNTAILPPSPVPNKH
jgi:uncharacterized protein (TIGR02246 family)